MALTVAILSLRPDKQCTWPDDPMLASIARKLAELLGSGRLRVEEQAVTAWLKGNIDSVKVTPLPAFVAFAGYLAKHDIPTVVDQVPSYSEIGKKRLEDAKIGEENLHLTDYQYLRMLSSSSHKPIVVVLPAQPSGSSDDLSRLHFVHLDYMSEKPLVQYRDKVMAVPFRVWPKEGGLTNYDVDEYAIRFQREAERCVSGMKRHLFHLLKSGLKPARPSNATYTHLLQEAAKLDPPLINTQSSISLPLHSSFSFQASKLAADYQALMKTLTDALEGLAVEAMPSVPYFIEKQGHVLLHNPGEQNLLDAKVEYLNADLELVALEELDVEAGGYKDITNPEAVKQLKKQGAVAMRLSVTGQFLNLPS